MLKALLRFLLRVLYGFEVRGTLARASKTLIVGNHQSFLDAAILWTTLPADTVWVVHAQVARQWVFRWLLKSATHIVVDTSNPFALKSAMAVIESGRPVVILPEGRLTITGGLMKVYDGPALVAAKTGATVAPLIIDGAVRARGFTRMKGDFPRAFFPKITLTFYPGTVIAMPEAKTGRLRRRKAGEALRRLLSRCLALSRPPTSLYEAFLDAVTLHGRGRRMVEDAGGADLTYGGLLRGSLALGRLVSKRCARDEVVGVLMPNAAATLALLLGMFAMRRIPAMLNFTAGLDGMQSAIRTARVKTVITSRAFLEKASLTEVARSLAGVELVYLEDLKAGMTLADKLWLVLYAMRLPRAATEPTRPEDPAVVLFTSGSEGRPKGVVLSHGAIVSDIAQCFAVIDISCADKILSAMPVFHSFGLTAGFMLPVLSGVRVFLYPSPLHFAIVPELFYDRNATVMFATPTFLRNYARRAHPYDFRLVRMLLSGAEKLPDDVRTTYMERFGVRLMEGYGATECGPVIAINTPMRYQSGTVGELLPLMEARLEPVPGIETGGHLHVRGPNVMLGYWLDAAPGVLVPPSSTAGPGWYATGDLATIDDDGFIHLVGRLKRFAKVAGEMVSLEVVEGLAEAASPEAVHAAVARPDPSRGEAIVLCTQDASLTRERLQEAARRMGLPELVLPRKIVVMERIPLLGSGKKDYPGLVLRLERPS